ncbi:MAG TPA: segregation/condensation protein A [Bdellovibrionales bacterium]|nr:segregation/condensation protein A [Bdellovibrionales bacterium]
MSILVHLEKFEGPLALLLYLIRKNEMDIYDIQITKITEQYLEYIRMMKELNLELAGDFVAMAATLIHIKSKMLLPQYDETGEQIEAEDPRKELVERLLEYEKFQQASKKLYGRPLLGREVYARGFKLESTSADPTIILDEGGLFAMIGLYRKVVRNIKKNVHVVMAKVQSLSSRILEIRNRLIPGKRLRFDELLTNEERSIKSKVVITFMSILELSRLGFTSIFQNEVYGPIHIDTKKHIERDVVSQVQELEAPELQALDLTGSAVVAVDEPEPEGPAASDEEILAAELQMDLLAQADASQGANAADVSSAMDAMVASDGGDMNAANEAVAEEPGLALAIETAAMMGESNANPAHGANGESAVPGELTFADIDAIEDAGSDLPPVQYGDEPAIVTAPGPESEPELAVAPQSEPTPAPEAPETLTSMNSTEIPDGSSEPEPSPAI